MQENNWLSISESYIQKGLSVIPVKGKVPLIENWQRWCSELMDEPIVVPGQTGIGICLGTASDLVAVDSDTNDPKILELIPYSPVVRKGRYDLRFYRGAKNIQSRTYSNWKIEILSTGRQAILPPSIHPNTKEPYIWTDNDLLNFDLENLPELDLSFLDKLHQLENNGVIKPSTTTVGGRHNKLKDIVTAIISRHEGIDHAAREAYKHDLENHNPRWFTDQSDKWKAKTEEEAQTCANIFASEMAISLMRSKVYQPILDFKAFTQSDDKKNEAPKFELKYYPEPAGILKILTDYTLEISYSYVPNMALGSAISILSTFLGNRFIFEDVKANTFCLLVAESGVGKSFGISAARNILSDLGYLGSADYLSSSAISSSLTDHCVRLDISDEFSKTLKLIKNGGHWQSAISQDLIKLWSASRSGFELPVVKKQKEDKDTSFKIENPFISILAATATPEFKNSLSKEAFTSGLLPRFLIFTDKVDPNPPKAFFDDVKIKPLLDECRRYAKAFINSQKEIVAASVSGHIDPIRYKLSDADKDFFIQKMDDYYFQTKTEENDFLKPILGRFREHFKALSMLHSFSRMDSEQLIAKQDMEWADEVLKTNYYNASQFLSEASAENKHQSEKERICNLIYSNPGISRRDLTRKSQWMSGLQRDNIIKDLIESDRIVRMLGKSKNNKPTEIFQISHS